MALCAPPKYRFTHPKPLTSTHVALEAPEFLPLTGHDDVFLYTRCSPQFAAVSKVWNWNNTAEPLAVARCLSISAVQRVIRFCSGQIPDAQQAGRQMPFVVRSGGHDAFNRSTIQHGLMLDVRGLDSITLSSDRQSVTIGGGVSGGNLINFLDEHGLITPSGYCNTVGYVGWAAGGGYGVLAGPYGLGVDQILGATLVDAKGNLVDTDSDANLLWALRGAGTGNFGVVVSMRVKVYERPPYLGGMILFPGSELGQVMTGLQQVTEETGSPDEFSGDCTVGQMPGLGAVFAIIFSWAQRHRYGSDPLKRAREVLGRCEGLGTVLLNTVDETTPVALMSTMQPMTSAPMKARMQTFTVSGLSKTLAAILAQSPVPSNSSMVIIHRSHGAATYPHSTHCEDPVTNTSCMPNRKPHTILCITGSAVPGGEGGIPETPGEYNKVSAWVEEISQRIVQSGIALPRTYVSWTTNKEADTRRLYGDKIAERLKDLKRIYDSHNLFSTAYPSLA